MDVVQDWAAYLMGDHTGMPPYAGQVFSIISTARSWIIPIVNQLTQKPDLATIALLLVIVLISLKILDMLYQTVVFWLRMLWRIVFWGTLVALALWMYTRGPDGVTDDIQYWVNTWHGEFERFKGQEQYAKLLRQQQGRPRGPAGRYY